jgi:transcriptional regulator with XRE-family HTH domain
MDLRKWIEKEGVSQNVFALKAQVSPVTLSKILHGQNIRLDIAMKIYFATNKEVTPIDLYTSGLEYKREEARKLLTRVEA